MGLQNQLNDVSSDSIPLLLVAVIATCIGNLRSFLLNLFSFNSSMTRFDPTESGHHHNRQLGSGLANVIVLAEQLNINRLFSYRYSSCNPSSGGDCMVCLCTLRDGEQVRKLDCRHVFHKECFDGWLDHYNFNCPLCRSPLVSDQRVSVTGTRVGGDLVEWFSAVY